MSRRAADARCHVCVKASLLALMVWALLGLGALIDHAMAVRECLP